MHPPQTSSHYTKNHDPKSFLFLVFIYGLGKFTYLCTIKHQVIIMATAATSELWAYIESLSLSRRDRNWLAGKLMEPSFQADPYEVSPSGDPFFADSRNVKAVEHDIAEAHRPNAKYTRLESKEDIMAMINDL